MAVEALIRWQHPKRGMISPADFIPVAEESSLIHEIGKLILKKAASDIHNLNSRLNTAIKVHVNLSPRQLTQANHLDQLMDILNHSGLSPKLLEVELTESALMENIEESAQALHAIKAQGINISIDDFGTGYSSLSLLKQLPVDNLKIDRMFVKDIPYDNDDMEIVSAIILMSHRLGLRVVAEGVETSSQAAFLAANHCDQVQGFFYAKPMSITDLMEYVASQTKNRSTRMPENRQV